MGDCKTGGKAVRKSILQIMSTVLKMKETQTAALVVRFQYRP